VIARSPTEFAAAVAAYEFDSYSFEAEVLRRAAESLAATGLLVVGESHGVHETPSFLYRLARELGTRALAFEWSYEELDETVQAFVAGAPFDFERLWSLPPSAELFCGDGRVTAGHFALLERLRADGLLQQAIAFDRLDPDPPEPWQAREQELARRLLDEWDGEPLLVLTGAFHAQLAAPGGTTMAGHLSRARRALAPAMLEYARGSCWSRGEQDAGGPMPRAPLVLRVTVATPAIVPGRSCDDDAAVSALSPAGLP
jgi:hypothetical protein